MKKILFTTFLITFISCISIAQEVKVLNLEKHIHAISIMGYTSLVVEGDEDVLITDTANPIRAEILKKEIEKLTDKPVGKIVLTHEHYDHTGGTEIFETAQIIAQRNVKNLEGLDPMDLFPDKVDILFDEYLVIDMGNTKVDLKYMGASDGAAMAVVHLPKERIVVTSDMYVDEGIGAGIFLTDTNLLGNRNTLNTLLSWNLKHAVNTHSTKTDIEPLERTAMFLNDLYDAILLKLKKLDKNNAQGLLKELMKLKHSLKLPQYENWTNYSDLPIYIEKMGFAIVHGG